MTTFNAGVGASTLPLYIYGPIKFGVTPEINAISTIIVAVTAVAILIAWRVGRVPRSGDGGRSPMSPDMRKPADPARGRHANRVDRLPSSRALPWPRPRVRVGDLDVICLVRPATPASWMDPVGSESSVAVQRGSDRR